MKNIGTQHWKGIAAAALLLGSASLALAQIKITNVIDTYDALPPNGMGQEIGHEWGPGSVAWDGTTGNPAGALQVSVVFDPASDSPSTAFSCKGPWGNPWNAQYPINFSEYNTLEFDILYDNTSDITIDQFNNVSTWPKTLTNSLSGGGSVFQSWANGGAALANDGAIQGIEIALCGGPGGQMAPSLFTTNIPSAASNGWTHVIIPINKGQANIDGVAGVVFHKWVGDPWALQYAVTARFWIDNLMLIGTAALPPPPTLSSNLAKPVPGLNVFSSTQGNGDWDRQEVRLVQTNGLSWVGHATTGNPVTYSFTISGYPDSVNCEAYLFLAPNESGPISGPDWGATNCAIFYLQGNLKDNATAHFRYKVNEPSNQLMYSGADPYTNAPGSWDGVAADHLESGDLASVTNSTGVLGTWQIQFTSDTQGAIIAPDGSKASFTFPAYNVGYFAENNNFELYLGMQGNQADGMNKAVVYSNFGVSGVATPVSQNFLSQSVLDTNIWDNSLAGGPKGVFVLPTTGQAYWLTWSLPASGYSLLVSGSLTSGIWNDVTRTPMIAMAGVNRQLVATSELPAGNCGFFKLVKRNASQLQVLFPGETNAPNTPTGKTGTPTAVSSSTFVTITVSAVDPTFHNVNGVSDTVGLSNSDGGNVAFAPSSSLTLTNGTATVQLGWLYPGTYNTPLTVTATDNSNTNIVSGTSAPVDIVP